MNKEEVLKFYRFLRHKNQTELRLFRPKWDEQLTDEEKAKEQKSWFVNNEEEFLKVVEKWDGEKNIYVGLNERKMNGKEDEDVEFITNIGHDIDAHSGQPDDFLNAQKVALQIKDVAIELGYKEPLVLCSGRGFWVIHHIHPIKNTAENVKRIKEFGKRIKEKYEVEGIDIDTSVYNPSRIARVSGTQNISSKENPVMSFIVNEPPLEEDQKLTDDILEIEVPTYQTYVVSEKPKDNCAFLDYCLTHQMPEGERHRVIARNMSIYIHNHPDRDLLKEQYCKIQKDKPNELDQYLKGIDEKGAESFPFSCGELVNFQKKYKISLKCLGCPKFKKYKQELREQEKLNNIGKIEQEEDYSNLQKEVMTCLVLKDRGKATELIVEEIKKKHHIYTTRDDRLTEIWIYNEGVYEPQGKSYIKEIVRKILGEATSGQICNEVLFKIETDTYINPTDFFQNNYLDEIPVQNGILHLFTRELKPFDPKKIFFNKLPVYYDPDADCPAIEKHLKDVLGSPDDIEVLYEIMGFLLYKDYFIEKMVMFVGNGRNGKGKTIDLMRRFIGVENCTSVPLTALNEDSYSVSELFGKMVNLAGDLSNTSLKQTGMLKQTTGRDLLGAKRKFLTNLKFINYAKHIFACNHLPKVYDFSDGFWERWVLFEFPYKFIPQSEYDALPTEEREGYKILDPEHIDKISSQEELNGLLNKALDGLDRIKENKEFSYSQGSSEIKKYWVRKADSFMAFCMDNLMESSGSKIPKADLRKAYHKYCKEHKTRGSSDKSISVTLQEMFGVIDGKEYSDGVTTYHWDGVDFQPTSKYKFSEGKLG